MYLMPLNCGLTNVNCLTLFNTLFNTGSHIIFLFCFIYLLATLGLRCCMGFSLVAQSRSCSLVAVLRLLNEAASLVAEHRC